MTNLVSPETNTPGTDASKAGTFQCPRCFREVRRQSESCPKCGLVFALWERGAVRAQGPRRWTVDEDPRAESLWAEVEARPEDETRHEAFLAYCQEARCLDLAAQRYQAFLLQNPGSRTGFLFRDRILLLAQFDSKAAPSPRYQPPRASWLKWILGLGAAALLLALFMARMMMES